MTKTADLQQAEEIIEQASTIIDGLFGIGLTRPIEGLFNDVISFINSKFK